LIVNKVLKTIILLYKLLSKELKVYLTFN